MTTPGAAPGLGGGIAGPGGGRSAMETGGSREDRLKTATREFESVFVQEMLKAMRATVPDGGLLDAGRSEEVFTSLLDEHVASAAAARSEGGLAEALYRQFTARSGR